ncbi:MAG: Crp/Fnr family transcriptional regulator [Oscillospiraceae bacterium]|nr:Crp/Fnr family transcriptional regulator [Oscillospiraceae bacterium]
MDYNFLADTVLFHGASPEEIKSMLGCLGAVEKTAAKGEVLFRAGSPAKYMAMVLSGSVQIENDDVWGNKSVLDSIGPGEVFAETYACVPDEPLQVSAVAVEKSALLLLDAARLLRTCPQACAHHVTLIRNLLVVSAQKNLSLSRRIFHTSAKTIRGRLLSYLSYQAVRSGGNYFDIPFNRQQLADYLSVDRSAMSAELSKMRKDGLLECSRSHFHLNTGSGELGY